MRQLQSILAREIHERNFIDRMNFKFYKTKHLQCHYGCVNALFISKDGYLLSSGDDLRLLLFKPSVFYDLDDGGNEENSPHFKISFKKHISNVFCVAANQSTTKLYSCGNDGLLIFYDVQKGTSDVRLAHEDACMRLSLHPSNENVLLTASQDFTIRLWDSRSSGEEGMFIPKRLTTGIRYSRNRSMQNYVEFNPTNPNEFVTSDATSGVFLWDIRNTLTYSTALRSQRYSPVCPLVTFTTRRVKNNLNTNNGSILISKPIDISSAVFSKDGKYICANIQKSSPVLYQKDNPDPIAVLDDPGWSSLATIKTGCFSHSIPGNLPHYFGGSDNGITYGFEIPPDFELLERQEKVPYSSTLPSSNSPIFFNQDTFNYIIPYQVASKYELKGGKSIINSCVSHPTDSIIVSAGVEKTVRIYSSIKELPLTEKTPKSLNPDTQESRVTLNLFSRLIEQERRSLESSDSGIWNRLLISSQDAFREEYAFSSSLDQQSLTFEESSEIETNTDSEDDEYSLSSFTSQLSTN